MVRYRTIPQGERLSVQFAKLLFRKLLAGGIAVNELLQDYPELEKEDIQAVFAYAVNLVDEEQVFPVEISG